ncbi:glucosidase II beta subunit-like-domain-containing protein [Cristinia sonorae]|uniref:Glucosidase 2 subunit beta n=1 Tax=Cristinia sonorae TaxID=1940300 RepID=A0A8K0UE15_9AGAR|nr:glucosidase II beta subunit-like-domain-containing protein [Cristinia sonorae]
MMLWLLLFFPAPIFSALDKTHGVQPAHLSKYIPAPGTPHPSWACLDGSKTIPWHAVNDDYCDCPDGSDEPGTGACPDTQFYCRNEGHIGALIPSSRVRDGLCEKECCDGSDELPGVCKNNCKTIGEEYRAKLAAERKLQKTGSKIRSTYIAFAQKEKKKLEGELQNLEREVIQRKAEVARLKDLADRAESLTEASMEQKRKSPLFQSLLTHHRALKSLQKVHREHLQREKALGDILDNLRSGYNPNYQDMAVLEAVRGWEHFAGLPHINDVKKDDEESQEDDSSPDEELPVEELEEGMWTETQLEHQLDSLLGSDYDSLLLEHDKHTETTTVDSILFDVFSYIPDFLVPQWEAARDAIFSFLSDLGLLKTGSTGKGDETGRARKALNDAEHSLKLTEDEVGKARTDLDRLFSPEWFGREGEWKKLEGLCLTKDTGDYTYEVCLFDEAKQKPNHGGSTFSLGRFAGWNDVAGVEKGSPVYYSKQQYTQGTKCWNGPARSVQLVLACGTENALLSVAELEKCEYQFTGTTPALCLPPDAGARTGHGEL